MVPLRGPKVHNSVHHVFRDLSSCCASATVIVFAGVIEYWSGSDHTFPQEEVAFTMKLDTDLFALAKAKTTSKSLEISKDGSQFAIFSRDRYGKHAISRQKP